MAHRRLGFLVGVGLVLLTGCEVAQKIDRPGRVMSVRDARKALAASLKRLIDVLDRKETVSVVRWDRQGAVFQESGAYGGKIILKFSEMDDFALVREPEAKPPCTKVTMRGRALQLVEGRSVHHDLHAFFEPEAAVLFVDAILTLKAAGPAPDTEERDFGVFSGQAQQWLLSQTRPAMPDAARADKAAAEEAFKRKEFAAALESYADALEAFPLWPEGQYNAALLAAEVGDYERAAHHMRRYLALAPDAKDTGASKEKFLLWQRKARE